MNRILLALTLSCAAACTPTQKLALQQQPPAHSVEGSWSGTLNLAVPDTAQFDLVEHGSPGGAIITGTMVFGTYPGPWLVAGNSHGNSITGIASGDASQYGCGGDIQFEATVTGSTISGTLSFPCGPIGGQAQTFSVTLDVPFAPPDPSQTTLTLERIRDADPTIDVYTLRRR